jgi:hypothetical protein
MLSLATYTVTDDLRSGAVVRVLPQYRLHAFNIVTLYRARRYLDAKVSKPIDFSRTISHRRSTICMKPSSRSAVRLCRRIDAESRRDAAAGRRMPRGAHRKSGITATGDLNKYAVRFAIHWIR